MISLRVCRRRAVRKKSFESMTAEVWWKELDVFIQKKPPEGCDSEVQALSRGGGTVLSFIGPHRAEPGTSGRGGGNCKEANLSFKKKFLTDLPGWNERWQTPTPRRSSGRD